MPVNAMPLEGLILINFNMYDDGKIMKDAMIYAYDFYDCTTSTPKSELFV